MKTTLLCLLCISLFACHTEESPSSIAASDIISHRDIPYAKIDGVDPNLLSLDIYSPKGKEALPVLLFVHGGGWRMGDKANQMERKPSFFTGLGFVFVSVNYRLAPDAQFPAYAQDVASSIAWVHSHIAEYGGDPNRLSLMGHSAGAHLVALVATDASFLQKSGLSLKDLSAVIALDGAGYDIPTQIENTKNKGAKIYQQAFGEDPNVWRSASPYFHIEPNKEIPPLLLIYGDRDASEGQGIQMADSLKRAGYSAETFHAKGKDHAAVNQDVGTDDEMTKTIVTFLQRVKG